MRLYYIGKPRDPHLNEVAGEFVKRASRYGRVEMREIHPQRIDLWGRHPAARKILLDPSGKQMDSVEFARTIANAEMTGRDLIFVVGGADGLPSAWASKADMLISLSRMTLPHELARAVLAEQIYRAFATLRGHPYPR